MPQLLHFAQNIAPASTPHCADRAAFPAIEFYALLQSRSCIATVTILQRSRICCVCRWQRRLRQSPIHRTVAPIRPALCKQGSDQNVLHRFIVLPPLSLPAPLPAPSLVGAPRQHPFSWPSCHL